MLSLTCDMKPQQLLSCLVSPPGASAVLFLFVSDQVGQRYNFEDGHVMFQKRSVSVCVCVCVCVERGDAEVWLGQCVCGSESSVWGLLL